MNEEELIMRVGTKIKALRFSRRMTQKELAFQCNFEKASVSRIEAGKTNLTIRSLYKICVALDVQIIELFKD